jgi:hypothetical protein
VTVDGVLDRQLHLLDHKQLQLIISILQPPTLWAPFSIYPTFSLGSILDDSLNEAAPISNTQLNYQSQSQKVECFTVKFVTQSQGSNFRLRPTVLLDS